MPANRRPSRPAPTPLRSPFALFSSSSSPAAAVVLVAALALLPALAGCRPSGSGGDDGPATTESPPAAGGSSAGDEAPTREGTATAADGVPIAYETLGEGEPALVFIHCWSCNRDFWRQQVEEFAADRRVVAIDLPGHGESGRERESWSIAGLGDDVRAVVEELGLGEVVLIGHSMGGPVALDAARRLGERVEGVVCVDTLHDAEFEWPEGMTETWATRLETEREAFMAEFIPSMFKPGADPEVVAWVESEALEADATATAALMRDFETLDPPAMLRDAGAPIRCINAAPGEQGMATAIGTNRKYADYDAVLLDDVGHFLQLERPDEFNRSLKELLFELAPVGDVPH